MPEEVHAESGEQRAQNFKKGRYEEGDAGVSFMFPVIPQKFRNRKHERTTKNLNS